MEVMQGGEDDPARRLPCRVGFIREHHASEMLVSRAIRLMDARAPHKPAMHADPVAE
jgi:hypothetical protein